MALNPFSKFATVRYGFYMSLGHHTILIMRPIEREGQSELHVVRYINRGFTYTMMLLMGM